LIEKSNSQNFACISFN